MSIEHAQSWMLRFPSNRAARERDDEYFELIGVTLRDRSGQTGMGWSFTSDYGGGEAVRALLDKVLVPRLTGRDATDVEVIAGEMRHLTNRLGRGIASLAIAAVDIALWDMRARMAGLPLARVLGQVRDRVPAYGSGKASPTLPIDELVSLSRGYVDDGFRAIKLRVGREPAADAERVRQVRAAIGPNVRIMCDANERLDLPTALWLTRQLAQFDIHWLEEPLPTSDIEGYRRLRVAAPMAIALGEHLFSKHDFTPYIVQGALDVVQPDVCLVGGFTEAMRVGAMADAHGLAVAPHFMTNLHIHLAAALPRAVYVEYYPFMDDLLEHGVETVDGDVLVPDRPGHGVSFTPDAWQRYQVC